MSDGREQGDEDDMRASLHEADEELTAERARAGLDHEGDEDDASGLAMSPFARLSEAYAMQSAETPNDANMHYLYGRQFFQVELYEDAAKALWRAVELNAQHAESHYYLAATLRQQGKKTDAAASYRRALEIDPKLFEARLELESLLSEGGNGTAG